MPAAFGGVSVAGLVPVSTGTAPSGAWRARRAPCTPLNTAVSTDAAISPSLAVESARSRPVRLPGFASVVRAAIQPSAAVPSPTALIGL